MQPAVSIRTRKMTPRSAPEEVTLHEDPSSIDIDGVPYDLYDIRATGDILLDVTFENTNSPNRFVTASAEGLRSAGTIKNLRLTAASSPGPNRPATFLRPAKSEDTRALYRVRLDTLKKVSKYFGTLLTDSRFAEACKIAACHRDLRARGIEPSEAEASELPRVSVTDEEDATRIAGREGVFADLLRILHDGDISMRPSIPYMTVLAVMADRFDCTEKVSWFVKRAPKKFPWPQTFGVMTVATEETLRQKILISWLLDDQPRFAAATKDLILRDSLRWNAEPGSGKQLQASWWDLQDGLEAELHFRRVSILTTLSSLQSHFLALYSSRSRQCKQFYDSSAACDSFQLGEMIKFLTHKNLLFLLSPLAPSYDDFPDPYGGDIENLLTTLRQVPSYQIDKNHSHCGLRTRLIPALDYIQAMLTANIGIDRRGWKGDRPATTWEAGRGEQSVFGRDRGAGDDEEGFRFTRQVAGDLRFKLESYLVANRYAKALFTAGRWDWSPEA